MQHTLVAVFDNRTDAQNAMNELTSSGFSRDEVKLSNADPTGMTDSITGRGDTPDDRVESDTLADGTGLGIGASIKHFFTDLFGADNSQHVSRYEGAVTRGHHVLTVRADSLPEVERAADIVERYGPTDIDEQASGEGAGMGTLGAGGMSESMRMSGAGGMQQGAQMSAQSDSLSGSSSGATMGSGSVAAGSSAGSAGLNQQLDDPGDRKLFQQQSLNQAEPMGTTYQEPMGKSGLSATGGTSLQGSTLQENSVQASALEGTQGDRGIHSSGMQGGTLQGSALEGSALQGGSGSMQRDTALGGSGAGSSGSRFTEVQRGKSRIYSRTADTGAGGGGGLDIGSNFFGDDDDYYRNHFLSNYSGEEYDRVKPAYAYGSEMARNEKYRGRKWDEVENDLRSDWDTRYGSTAGTGAGAAIGGTWEKMKAAVRRGWDRMTLDNDDDNYYRSHYDTHMSSSGMDYDSVKPAYSYGSEMRKSEMYRNRPWDDIEGDLARGWDSRIDAGTGSSTAGTTTGTTGGTMAGAGASVGGAWDKMKAAVRHGWDRITEDDDNEYRSHWNATYSTATGAGSYDEYRPAYAYGTEMARNEKYRGRQWGEVENDLRTDWDTRYGSGGQSTWEKMKSAVRHGWDRVTS